MDERKFRAVQPVDIGTSPLSQDLDESDSVDDETGEQVVKLVAVEDPFFPSEMALPDGFEIDDIQGPDGEKIEDDKYYIVVYPYGWIDPVTIHLFDDDRDQWTGFLNSVTGRVRWQEGYSERIAVEMVTQ